MLSKIQKGYILAFIQFWFRKTVKKKGKHKELNVFLLQEGCRQISYGVLNKSYHSAFGVLGTSAKLHWEGHNCLLGAGCVL